MYNVVVNPNSGIGHYLAEVSLTLNVKLINVEINTVLLWLPKDYLWMIKCELDSVCSIQQTFAGIASSCSLPSCGWHQPSQARHNAGAGEGTAQTPAGGEHLSYTTSQYNPYSGTQIQWFFFSNENILEYSRKFALMIFRPVFAAEFFCAKPILKKFGLINSLKILTLFFFVLEYSRIFQNIPNNSRIFKNIQKTFLSSTVYHFKILDNKLYNVLIA